ILRIEPAHAPRSRFTSLVAVAAGLLVLLLPVLVWRLVRQNEPAPVTQACPFALMAVDTHLRHMRGQLPLETESANPREISDWFVNKVNFSVKLPNYQESS